MTNTVYCPKPECNTPAENDTNLINVRCPRCNFHFCTKCTEEAHQGDCSTSDDQTSTSRDHNEARERERKRQRKKEERKTLDELKRSDRTRKCPGCKCWIEKVDGCDHMTCKNCEVSF